MRRVDVTAATSALMDYCTAGPQFASGGFIADSDGRDVINGSQQQCLVRDSSGRRLVQRRVEPGVLRCAGAPATVFPPITTPTETIGPYTTLATNPVSREKPYLYVDDAGA